ncbi:hypothetical protein [uncultured Clostridium sp.]|uniref:hypothetical protein n=1 Tax=uncultured Clostridium sp. TaxID=59620 RepID=UPI0025DC6B18|nr:hypothetical protein [uncultured Clostridium sp.]
MKNGLIEVEETDLHFNKCICCGIDIGTKKITLGSENKNEYFVLCKACRENLYKKLEMSLSHQIVTR